MRRLAALVLVLAAAGALAHGQHDPAAAARLEIQELEVSPWTHLEFANDPENFQFLIVSDRTGGHREGVFPEALRKAKLLHPEFILSVGDLIEGYTEDREQILAEWEEFDGFLEGLDYPFFYVPGNHDFTNEVMADIWRERYGPDYYHFVYRDVLFLCANTQDGEITRIGDEQLDYFRRVLADHPEVRWTLLFLHKPLWVYEDEDAPGWSELDALLQGRDYTVFAGHFHTYTKHVIHDRRYFVLATTGGVSGLEGPDRGQFDHVVWVTMTGEGPLVANLMLDGIWDEDVFTTRSARLLEQLADIRVTPQLARPDGSVFCEASLRLTNDEDIPLGLELTVPEGDWTLEDEVPPNEISVFPLPAELAADGALPLQLRTSYEPEDHRSLDFERGFSVAVEELATLPLRDQSLGGEGGRLRFNLSRDEEHLIVDFTVEDDELQLADPPARRWIHDYVELRVDVRPLAGRELLRSQWDTSRYLYLGCFPTREEDSDRLWYREEFAEAPVVEQSLQDRGWKMKVAIPLAHLAERAGVEKLEAFSFNLTLVDRDGEESESHSWRTHWHREEAAVGAGSFLLD